VKKKSYQHIYLIDSSSTGKRLTPRTIQFSYCCTFIVPQTHKSNISNTLSPIRCSEPAGYSYLPENRIGLSPRRRVARFKIEINHGGPCALAAKYIPQTFRRLAVERSLMRPCLSKIRRTERQKVPIRWPSGRFRSLRGL